MNKLSHPLIFTILFFTIKCFGGTHSSLLASSSFSSPLLFPSDTGKKIHAADSAKKIAANDSTDDDDDGTDTMRSYAIGLNYGSDQAYHGVHSNIKLPYLEPNFTYTAISGFYTELLDQYYLLGKDGKYNAFAANPGWDITLGDNTTLDVSLTHYFIQKNPPPKLVTSDISNSFATFISQSIGETEGKFTIEYDYYKKTSKINTPNDWIFTPDINHTFKIRLSKKSSVSLVPEGNLDFGTRNGALHYAANGGDTLAVKGNSKKNETETSASGSFGTLDYNLIFTVKLKIHHFEFEPALTETKPLYQVPGQSQKAYGLLSLALTYTIY